MGSLKGALAQEREKCLRRRKLKKVVKILWSIAVVFFLIGIFLLFLEMLY